MKKRIKFVALDLENLGILAFHDASHASMPGLRSQSGRIHFITDGVATESTSKI